MFRRCCARLSKRLQVRRQLHGTPQQYILSLGHWCICTCAVHTELCLRRTTGTAGCDVSRASVRDATRQLQQKPRSVTLAEIIAENDFKNDLVLWVLPRQLRNAMPRVVQSWVSMQWCGAKPP